MDLNAKVKTIFDTLPTGYYVGRRIKAELTDAPASYYIPEEDKIIIARNVIMETMLKHAAKGNFSLVNDDTELEQLIRGIIYHELSHVILTGPYAAEGYQRWVNYTSSSIDFGFNFDIMNIMEDERIETILSDYYMLTDFKKNIVQLCGFAGEPATDLLGAFFQLVRFHIGTDEWIDKLTEFIDDHKSFNAASDSCYWCDDYVEDLYAFYCEFARWYNDQQRQSQQQSQQSQSSDSSDSSDETQKSTTSSDSGCGNGETAKDQSTDEDEENDSENQNENEADSEDDTDADSDGESDTEENPSGSGKNSIEAEITDEPGFDSDDIEVLNIGCGKENLIKDALDQVFNAWENNSLEKRLDHIINCANKKRGMFEGARRGYAGKIDPKSCGRDDYKWFKKQNNTGNLNGISKLHLNLFIDNSGSWNAELEINQLLRALSRLKSSTFDFNVVTINTVIDEWTSMKQFVAGGGTDLDNDIAPVIKKLQKPGCNNYNIVVFDGEAHSNCYSTSDEPFRHFDTPNTVLVVDSDNARYIKNLSKCRKTVINSHYADHFIDEVLRLLESVL